MATYRGTVVYFGFNYGKAIERRAIGYGSTEREAILEAKVMMGDGPDWGEMTVGEAVQEVEEYSGAVGYRQVYVKGSPAGYRKGSSYTNKFGTKVVRKGYYYPGSKGYYKTVKVAKGKRIEYVARKVDDRTWKARREDKGSYPLEALEQ